MKLIIFLIAFSGVASLTSLGRIILPNVENNFIVLLLCIVLLFFTILTLMSLVEKEIKKYIEKEKVKAQKIAIRDFSNKLVDDLTNDFEFMQVNKNMVKYKDIHGTEVLSSIYSINTRIINKTLYQEVNKLKDI